MTDNINSLPRVTRNATNTSAHVSAGHGRVYPNAMDIDATRADTGVHNDAGGGHTMDADAMGPMGDAHTRVLRTGRRLKVYFVEHGLTASFFAQSIGYSLNALSRYLNGHGVPSWRLCYAIQQATHGAISAEEWGRTPPRNWIAPAPIELACERLGESGTISASIAMPSSSFGDV